MKPPIVLSVVIMKGSDDAITTWYARIVSEAIIWLIVPIDHIDATAYHAWHTINNAVCLRFNGLNSYQWGVKVQYRMENKSWRGYRLQRFQPFSKWMMFEKADEVNLHVLSFHDIATLWVHVIGIYVIIISIFIVVTIVIFIIVFTSWSLPSCHR